jgi:hypothetical protein
MDEDGDLALARLTPEGATILAQAKIFDTTTWTAPTLVGTTLYARDREKIVALSLGASVSAREENTREPGRDLAVRGPSAAGGPRAQRAFGAELSGETAAPGLGGTWRLDPSASRVDPAARLTGLIAAGAPPMLFITQPANGQVIVESPINEGHVRVYQPGGKTQTPAGQGGTITMTSRWDSRALVSEGTSMNAAGETTAVKERYAVSDDGKVLTVEITMIAGDVKNSSARYNRITSVGGCETWPTPCKR